MGPVWQCQLWKLLGRFFESFPFVIVCCSSRCAWLLRSWWLLLLLAGKLQQHCFRLNWMGSSRRRPSNLHCFVARFPHLNWSTKSRLTQCATVLCRSPRIRQPNGQLLTVVSVVITMNNHIVINVLRKSLLLLFVALRRHLGWTRAGCQGD